MRTVYIETSIPSFYFETRQTPSAIAWREVTREWWSTAPGRYRLVTSRFTYGELRKAPNPKRTEAVALLRSAELLEVPPELNDVIAFYLDHKLMPQGTTGDAAHLAMASLARADFLATWNISHLANANKFRQMEVINARLGLPTPLIVNTIRSDHGGSQWLTRVPPRRRTIRGTTPRCKRSAKSAGSSGKRPGGTSVNTSAAQAKQPKSCARSGRTQRRPNTTESAV